MRTYSDLKPTSPDTAYSIRIVAQHLEVSRGTVYNMVKAGHLKTITLPNVRDSTRVTATELARFLRARENA